MKKTTVIQHYRMNIRLGMFAFLMHRITGIILLLFGVLYLLSFSAIIFGPQNFDHLMNFYNFPFVRVFVSIFILALAWYALSGLRLFLISLFKADRIQQLLVVIQIILFVVGTVLYLIYA